MSKIAIIGGGIAGSSIGLYLAKLGLDITIFEKNESLVSGPPICHLHAGGNLYREISDQSCITLLKQSIDILKMYKNAVDFRPTVLAIPKSDDGNVEDLLPRLNLLKNEYKKLINEDYSNKVLCDESDYYKLYTKEDMLRLKEKESIQVPNNFDDYMISVAKNVDLEKLKFPLILVQEYGLNIFRLAAKCMLEFETMKNSKISLNTKVTNILQVNDKYIVEYKKDKKIQKEEFDYIINAAGFKTGSIDDMMDLKVNRLVEFKSAYVTKWNNNNELWPEVIFFGKRGTPAGMAQFTPYPNGHFQIHGMTKDITLFEEGLVKNSKNSSQPSLNKKFLNKIYKSWSKEDINTRTNRSIEHIKQYIPTFDDVSVASKPLYGAQQIPGDDAELRTADVSFDKNKYARCEIVKASSVLTMSDLIVKDLISYGMLQKDMYKKRDFLYKSDIKDEDITKKAQDLCKQRDYPLSLARRNFAFNKCFDK
jgi:hypothetical protein